MTATTEPTQRRTFRRGELTAAASAALLLFSMFALKWFGVDGVPGRRGTHTKLSTSQNAWQSLSLLRWLMLLTAALAIGTVVIHATQRSHGAKTNMAWPLTLLGTLSAGCLAYRVLVDLPSPRSIVDQKLGALIGLFSAISIAIAGHRSWRDERGLEHSSRPDAEREPRASVSTAAPRRRVGGGRDEISNQYPSQP